MPWVMRWQVGTSHGRAIRDFAYEGSFCGKYHRQPSKHSLGRRKRGLLDVEDHPEHVCSRGNKTYHCEDSSGPWCHVQSCVFKPSWLKIPLLLMELQKEPTQMQGPKAEASMTRLGKVRQSHQARQEKKSRVGALVLLRRDAMWRRLG